MSYNRKIYIGAFAIIKLLKEEIEVEEKICPKCNKGLSANFCPQCGQKAVMVYNQEFLIPELFELMEENFKQEPLISVVENEEEVIVIGNMIGDKSSIEIGDEQAFQISKEDPELFVNNFKEYYQEVLSFLKKHPLVKSIKISFGVISHFS